MMRNVFLFSFLLIGRMCIGAGEIEDSCPKHCQRANLFGYPSQHPFPQVNQGITQYKVQHPGAYRSILLIDGEREGVVFEDRSFWVLAPQDYASAKKQDPNVYVITTNGNPLSSAKYQIVHLQTDTSWKADVIAPPSFNDPFAYFITQIDPYEQRLFLNDGSSWKVSMWDISSLVSWEIFDPIIIGVNSGVGKFFNPHILINPERGNYADASYNESP